MGILLGRRLAVFLLLGSSTVLGCGGSVKGTSTPDASLGPKDATADAGLDVDDGGFDSSFPVDDAAFVCPPGSPLSCYVDNNCATPTTLTGTVYDPAGRNPIYNAIVFVPNDPAQLTAIPSGVECNACDQSIGDYASATATDPAGRFTLRSVPTGKNLPLVMQVGKWRRMITVPEATDCATTAVPPSLTRLPRNHTEGNMPDMALLTGGCDNMACFLRSVGIDASEFSGPHAGGHVDVYQGLGATGAGAPLSGGAAGDCTSDACPLWSSTASLKAYDTVVLGCECGENNQTKPASSLMAMHDYLEQGGKVIAIHAQATWFKNGPADFQAVANWTDGGASGGTGPFLLDTSFRDGENFKQWLVNTGAVDSSGAVPLSALDVSTSVTTVTGKATRWIYDGSPVADAGETFGNVKALSFRAPTVLSVDAGEVATQCGSAYFTDIHAAGGQALQDTSGSPAAVPAACDGGPMTTEEKALEFLFFYQPPCQSDPLPPPPPRP